MNGGKVVNNLVVRQEGKDINLSLHRTIRLCGKVINLYVENKNTAIEKSTVFKGAN